MAHLEFLNADLDEKVAAGMDQEISDGDSDRTYKFEPRSKSGTGKRPNSLNETICKQMN